MPKRDDLGRFIELLADRIGDGVTRSLRDFMDAEFKDLKRKMVAAGMRRGPGRPPGSGRRRGRPPAQDGRATLRSAAVEARRAKILGIVRSANGGISSVDVARKLRKDPRGVGILLSGLAREGVVQKTGKLYKAV